MAPSDAKEKVDYPSPIATKACASYARIAQEIVVQQVYRCTMCTCDHKRQAAQTCNGGWTSQDTWYLEGATMAEAESKSGGEPKLLDRFTSRQFKRHFAARFAPRKSRSTRPAIRCGTRSRPSCLPPAATFARFKNYSDTAMSRRP